MNRETGGAAGPSWLSALVGAFHPVRLGLCAAGLAFSVALCSAASSVFGDGVTISGWWQRPGDELFRLADHLLGHGFGTAFLGCSLLAAGLWVLWGPVAGWIARSEFLRQRGDEAAQTTATGLLLRRASAFVTPLLMCLFFVGMLLLVLLFGAAVNRVPALGPVLVSLLLPAVAVCSLVAVLMLLGAASFCVMPAAVAAEGGDAFDALSRGYTYLIQKPLTFVVWWGLATALAAAPLAGALWLVRDRPGFLGPAEPAAVWAAAVLSASIFWTLQGLVHLKLRRAVDDVGEDEVWDGPAEQSAPGQQSGQPVTNALDPEPAPAGRVAFAFKDTLSGAGALDPRQLVVLLGGAVWAALMLAAAVRLAGQVTGAGPDWTPEGLREVVAQLAGERPLLAAALFAAAVLLGAAGVAWCAKVAARRAAAAASGASLSLSAAASFPGRTRGVGFVSACLVTAGVQSYLAALCLVPAAVRGACGWNEAALAGAAAAVLLGAGSLGLGAAGVEGRRREGALAILLDNGAEILASAALVLVLGLLRWAAVLGVAGMVWRLTCESLTWLGGDAQWARWGLDGQLWPAPQGAAEQLAALIAGAWLALFVGLLLTYPVSAALRWGVSCYLLSRQRAGETPVVLAELTAEEQADLSAGGPSRRSGGA